MAMFTDAPKRPEPYEKFVREVPQWYRDVKFGVFIHWGAYSVPAWAEPIGELGTIERTEWMKHNPYAEWYFNTIRIDGSPAQEHHRTVHGGAPYDDFLDRWSASAFDPADLVDLFRRAGAGYVVPTTKHHDGITLWDAPGTGDRNTVRRGPERDLVAALAEATRAAGLKFGTYYSTGLDWHFADSPPLTGDAGENRPVDRAYADYVFDHLSDLIDKVAPDVLWADIEYPDAGKTAGPKSLLDLFEKYYAAVPEGVVNDRFGLTHWDFRTSEYQAGREAESAGAWENCRGVGFSFGYNQVEDASHYLDGPGAVKHLLDVVSRGGNFLLNVGPDEAGRIPALQRACLEGVADWMALNSPAVHGTTVLDGATASDDPWVRYTRTGSVAHAVVDASGEVVLDLPGVDVASARTPDGTPVTAREDSGRVVVDVPAPKVPGPVVVDLDLL
ncbi:alpha-L-fucosidase [Kineococcus rhizosphaerae]|uniref:alpha-L-fucosidase n=1 Tax=Kineococcus rhizosphaerae TaxID=559628 RepID=A0A2T0R0N4_9ACTN|nr:alpha-L-fucosidase [Kineococcus rhizosphaerae]